MGKVQFEVSAKTARLIGRENISDVDGAIVELIKNSYDADATCVFVLFNMPFPAVPKTITYETVNNVFGNNSNCLLEYYEDDGTGFNKRTNLTDVQERQLQDLLYSQNSIIVMDNGYGMDEQTLRFAWMNIGTNDKEEKRISPKGRIKTGAKGIGRFALDKLSTSTVVYTKNDNDSLKKWQINWEQFETANLLNEVTATIDDCNGSFFQYAEKVVKGRFKGYENYSWDSGTIIKLSPTRETWSESYFSKVNRDLKSLFPSTNDSQFDIYVTNIFYPRYSFANERFVLNKSEYDYKIVGTFDGVDNISVHISRNEIDTRKLKIDREINGQKVSLSLSEFWKRDAFKKEKYIRSDFAKTINYSFSAQSLTKCEPAALASVGAFVAEFYFLKNSSSTIEIVLPVVTARRKEILSNYSGVKLYRDGFKVRPYGEEGGPSFDWLSLGLRAQRSPAAVSHSSGSWRVRSNQIIGEVRISKDTNPNLSDMANREGLAVNDAYKTFITIIEKIIETFEYDRQYIFKEYATWLKQKENEISNVKDVVAKVKENQNDEENLPKKPTQQGDANDEHDQGYTRSDYERTILTLDKERERQERTNKTLMLYSSAGVMTNTFSHEISRIMTKTGSRMQHIREAIKRSVGEYKGNELFNPYSLISAAENIDKLIENWITILMSGTSDESFSKKTTNIYYYIDSILIKWKPLLETKLIKVSPVTINGDKENYLCTIAEVDLLIIMNNFLLNSADFLENANVTQREINVSILEEQNRFVIILENNGPPLDGIFANNPDRIFDAGVSTKETDKGKGSGIGLWITQMLVQNNSGEIHPMNKKDGFGLKICLPK